MELTLPPRIKVIYKGQVKFFVTPAEIKTAILSFGVYPNKVHQAIFEYALRIYQFSIKQYDSGKVSTALINSIGNCILKYAYSLKNPAQEKLYTTIFWDSLVGSLDELIDNPEARTLLPKISPINFDYIREYSQIGATMIISTESGQQRPLLNVASNVMDKLLQYRNSQIIVPDEEMFGLEAIQDFITDSQVGLAQIYTLNNTPKDVVKDVFLKNDHYLPGETLKTYDETTMKSDVTEESIETVVDKVSDEAVSELMDEVENQNSLRTGETINSMVSKNQGTTFNIGGHVNAKFKGIVDMGVNTNFNTTSQTNDTLTKTANVERFAQSIEKSVSKQVYKKNTERELTISNRRMTSEERTQKNIQERESTNSSGRYALDVDTHQAAQVYESILKLDDVIIMIGNGIKTLSLDDYEALRDYVPASVFENIKLAIENFAVRLYNDQIVHPFKDGLKNPDDKTQEQFKYGLPLTRRQYAMRLNGIKKFSKLARGNDVENPSHMDEYQEQLMENRIKREEKALEMDDVEIKKRAAEVDEIVMKNTYMQKIIDSEHMDNPLTVFPLSMALFNNSNVPSKMYMMDKVPDSIVKQINQIGYKKE